MPVFMVVLTKDTGSVTKRMTESTKDNMDYLYLEEKSPYYIHWPTQAYLLN